jgi:hypothetical protein
MGIPENGLCPQIVTLPKMEKSPLIGLKMMSGLKSGKVCYANGALTSDHPDRFNGAILILDLQYTHTLA